MVPEYLSSLTPASVSSRNYSLRNSSDIRTVLSRTSSYYSSFLPSTVRAWNNLPGHVRNSPSISVFKQLLYSQSSICPSYFYHGMRRLQVIHARIRTQCSALNHHLFFRNIVNSPLCTCGETENSTHFFLQCPLYSNIRETLIRDMSEITDVNIEFILNGNPTLDHENNCNIFTIVHNCIHDSKRFC